MRKFATIFSVMLIAMQALAACAQTPESQTLNFTLAIEEKPLEAENSPGTHILLVKYTNISDTVQRDPCVVSPWEYKLVVLRDGTPAEKRNAHKKKTEEPVPPGAIKLELDERKVCSATDRLSPGQSVKFPLWVSSEYDMTAPGTYDITVTRETDPWNPEKSVTVKSNTLTVVVPEPGAGEPK
jgi:hypothetical protein